MKFQGALIKEQGIRFGVVIVKKSVYDNPFERDKAARSFQPLFPGVPLVLMAQDSSGTPHYYGRRDIVQFLSNVPLNAIPWSEYTVG